MGTADAILDLVSSGTTLRENNLKQIDGGLVLESQVRFRFPINFLFSLYFMTHLRIEGHLMDFLQGVLVANKQALLQRPTALEITHEILERLEAHLRAEGQFTVTLSNEYIPRCILVQII